MFVSLSAKLFNSVATPGFVEFWLNSPDGELASIGVTRLSAESNIHPFSQFTMYMIVSCGCGTMGVILLTLE